MSYSSDWLAIIIAAAGSFMIGFMWFGPLFGKKWMALMKFRPEDIEAAKQKGMSSMAKQMTIAGVANIVTAYIFFSIAETMLLGGTGTVFCLALLVWIGFAVPIFLNTVLWEGKSWPLFWLSSTHVLATLIFTALIYTWMVV